ncbi:hypothetical protein L579_1305 [Pantoea sp. AS-PWVM4]|uniref:hypothetical protein n=1 Tax=Pantoea sp. AS-PWVM4 TaxID=1332069 RepID=UPI0003AC765C|nr:hypothetical protein [Pantoea sp. AS-PWVM4]ERK09522.1 hypothetical protein L579_1305 [Pantoea sp. AS-PWVM4]
MKIYKKSIIMALVLFSQSTLANTLPATIYVMSHGKSVASFDVPVATKIDISAEHQESNTEENKTYFKGKVRVLLTFSSGEVMHMQGEEFEILSKSGTEPDGKASKVR